MGAMGIDVGNNIMLMSAGLTDIFVMKLGGTNGNTVWGVAKGGAMDGALMSVVSLGGSFPENVVDAAFDPQAGDVVVAGQHAGDVDFGGGTLSSVGGDDVFLLRITSAFGYKWARSYGSMANDRV